MRSLKDLSSPEMQPRSGASDRTADGKKGQPVKKIAVAFQKPKETK